MYTTELARGWGSKLHILTKGTHSSDFLAKKRCVTSGSFVPDLPPLQRLINSGISSTPKTTYRGSPKKPTVGRLDDLPQVASTTHSRFHFASSEEGLLHPQGRRIILHNKRGGIHQGLRRALRRRPSPTPHRALPAGSPGGCTQEGRVCRTCVSKYLTTFAFAGLGSPVRTNHCRRCAPAYRNRATINPSIKSWYDK